MAIVRVRDNAIAVVGLSYRQGSGDKSKWQVEIEFGTNWIGLHREEWGVMKDTVMFSS